MEYRPQTRLFEEWNRVGCQKPEMLIKTRNLKRATNWLLLDETENHRGTSFFCPEYKPFLASNLRIPLNPKTESFGACRRRPATAGLWRALWSIWPQRRVRRSFSKGGSLGEVGTQAPTSKKFRRLGSGLSDFAIKRGIGKTGNARKVRGSGSTDAHVLAP